MELRISRIQRQLLLDWARLAEPDECCGLLLGSNGVVGHVTLAPNVACNPEREFEIAPAALITAERQERQGGPAILGYFHSHPNGVSKPSAKDAGMAAADGRIWLIIAGSEITAWRPERDGADGGISFAPVGIVWG